MVYALDGLPVIIDFSEMEEIGYLASKNILTNMYFN